MYTSTTEVLSTTMHSSGAIEHSSGISAFAVSIVDVGSLLLSASIAMISEAVIEFSEQDLN